MIRVHENFKKSKKSLPTPKDNLFYIATYSVRVSWTPEIETEPFRGPRL